MRFAHMVSSAPLLAIAFVTALPAAAENLSVGKLDGTWAFANRQTFQQYKGTLSAQIETVNPDGSFVGTFTFNGVACNATNTPMSGKMNGATLTIDIPVIGACGNATMVARKLGDKNEYEGELDITGAPGRAAGINKVSLRGS
jgi:hypothetical protein